MLLFNIHVLWICENHNGLIFSICCSLTVAVLGVLIVFCRRSQIPTEKGSELGRAMNFSAGQTSPDGVDEATSGALRAVPFAADSESGAA